LIDPIYLDDSDFAIAFRAYEKKYDLDTKSSSKMVHRFTWKSGRDTFEAFVSDTGMGDGFYPVYAKMRQGRVMQLLIRFDKQEVHEKPGKKGKKRLMSLKEYQRWSASRQRRRIV
jgi:hypothetical protein